jgi:hypothetical protein
LLSSVFDGMLSSTPHQRLNGDVFKRFAEKSSPLQLLFTFLHGQSLRSYKVLPSCVRGVIRY